jgi:hypothetical protein
MGSSGGITGGLSLFACSGSGRKSEGDISGGEITNSGEFPVRDNQGGVLVDQLASLLRGLALAVGAAFTPEGAEGGGVTAGF